MLSMSYDHTVRTLLFLLILYLYSFTFSFMAVSSECPLYPTYSAIHPWINGSERNKCPRIAYFFLSQHNKNEHIHPSIHSPLFLRPLLNQPTKGPLKFNTAHKCYVSYQINLNVCSQTTSHPYSIVWWDPFHTIWQLVHLLLCISSCFRRRTITFTLRKSPVHRWRSHWSPSETKKRKKSHPLQLQFVYYVYCAMACYVPTSL